MMHFLAVQVNDSSPNLGDVTAVTVGIGAWLQYLPSISCGLTIIWVGLRIFISIRDEILKRKEKKDGDE